MKRSLTFYLVIVVAAMLILVGLLALPGGVGLPVKWELPPGYKGWVTLRYLDASCQVIERQGFFLVIKVSGEGIACTSEFLERRWRHNIFEYVNADGSVMKAEASWGDSEYRPGGGLLDRWFIGTQLEFEQNGSALPPTPMEWSNQNAGGTHPQNGKLKAKK